jgi:hypothetical protein
MKLFISKGGAWGFKAELHIKYALNEINVDR